MPQIQPHPMPPMWDAYQEALDLAMYLRQAIMEREVK